MVLASRQEFQARRAWQATLWARVHGQRFDVATAPASLLAGAGPRLAPSCTLKLSSPVPAGNVLELVGYDQAGAEQRVWYIARSVERWLGFTNIGPELVGLGLQLHEQLPRLACYFRGRERPLLVLPAPGRQAMRPATVTALRQVRGYAR